MIQLISDELPPSRLAVLADSYGWVTSPAPCQIMAVQNFGPDSLAICLDSPQIAGIEDDEGKDEPLGQHFLRHLKQGGIGLAVTTSTAYQCDLAMIFSASLLRRHPQWGEQAPGLERAIHELVANALVHGNLQVASPKTGMEGFDTYCQSLDMALSDPKRSSRRIEISASCIDDMLEVAVRDQGPGYEFCRIIDTSDDAQPRQHGLAIISEIGRLTVEDGGRCSILRFSSAPPAAP